MLCCGGALRIGGRHIGKKTLAPTAGPNTLVGLATVAPGVDRSELVARLVPAYTDLLKQLQVNSSFSAVQHWQLVSCIDGISVML